jgi:hypothetical protein
MTEFMWCVLVLLGVIGAELGLLLVIFGLLTYELIGPKKHPDGSQPILIGMPPGMHPGMLKKEENGDKENGDKEEEPNKGLYV